MHRGKDRKDDPVLSRCQFFPICSIDSIKSQFQQVTLYSFVYCILTADSEVYIKKEKTQNSQHSIKGEKQCPRTDIALLQALFYSNQDTVILVKKHTDE